MANKTTILLALAALAFSAFAGCAGSKSSAGNLGADGKADAFDNAVNDVNVQATATTGVIRGVVVDAAIRPLAKAVISVVTREKTLVTNTTLNGAFGFQGLQPGTYFLKAHKAGFTDQQVSVDVKAGVSDPPVSKIQLAVDRSFVKPYYNVVKHAGFVECTTSVLVLCGAPNLIFGLECQGAFAPVPAYCIGNLTNDRFTWDEYFEPNATMIQSEMVWTSSQAASPALYFEMETLNGGCEGGGFLNNTRGESPIYATVNASVIQEHKIGVICPIYYSVFSGDAVEAAAGSNPSCLPGAPCIGVGATVEQTFDMYMHSFYGFTPPAGWRFSKDGDPPLPV